MNRKTIIIGHKNPDTDSICSAIAYSEFKRIHGAKGIIAGRAGNINPQTDFVLRYFGKEPPTFFSDVYPRLSDIMIEDVITALPNTPILDVMRKFKEKGARFMPVVTETNKVIGTLVASDLAEQFISMSGGATVRQVRTTLGNIASSTDSEIILNLAGKKEKNYAVFVGAMSQASFNKTIEGHNPSKLIIVVGDRYNIIEESIAKGCAIVITTGGLKLTGDIVERARGKGVSLMSSPHDSASTAWLAKLSAPAIESCSNKYLMFKGSERVETAKRVFLKSNEKGMLVVDENERLRGVITKSNFLKPPGIKLILLDHNELSQAIDGADQAEIIEVVDHHRMAGFQTSMPIDFTIRPVGSTCTLIAEKYRETKTDLDKSTAGMLLAGIISDTLTGRSPTTTNCDLEAMKWLEDIAGISKDKFSVEMFEGSSLLTNRSVKDIILNDFKAFTIGKNKVGIGQVEVVGFNKFHQIKEEIMASLEDTRKEKGFDLVALMVTDITYEVTLLCVSAPREIYMSIELPESEANIFEMKNVLSRKKQVVPYLFNILGG